VAENWLDHTPSDFVHCRMPKFLGFR